MIIQYIGTRHYSDYANRFELKKNDLLEVSEAEGKELLEGKHFVLPIGKKEKKVLMEIDKVIAKIETETDKE